VWPWDFSQRTRIAPLINEVIGVSRMTPQHGDTLDVVRFVFFRGGQKQLTLPTLQPPHKTCGVKLKRLGKLQELHDVEAPLAAFDLGDIRLLPSDPLGELDLSNAGLRPRCDEHPQKSSVAL
jgi:hypothetical protein